MQHCRGDRDADQHLPHPLAGREGGPAGTDGPSPPAQPEHLVLADGVPEIAQARRLGPNLENRIVETYVHVPSEVDQRLVEEPEARWHAATACLHPNEPALTAAGNDPRARRGSVM